MSVLCSGNKTRCGFSWWRHAMETLSALLPLCEGKPPVTGAFLSQRAANVGFLFDISLNKRLNKSFSCWWLETPWRSLWRHCKAMTLYKSWRFNLWAGQKHFPGSWENTPCFAFPSFLIIKFHWLRSFQCALRISNIMMSLLGWSSLRRP